MDLQGFKTLLQAPESWTVDFKEHQYDISKNPGQADLIKDIISMANTIRQDTAYIVRGVKEEGGVKTVTGVDHHIDDATIQEIVRAKVSPVPRFLYSPLVYQDKKVAVIEIPISNPGPFVPAKDFGGKINRNQVYFRSGSSNQVATPIEIVAIADWFKGNSLPEDRVFRVSRWDEFSRACASFDKSRLYILVIGKSRCPKESLVFLGVVPWNLVLDFDPETHETGAFGTARELLQSIRFAHLFTHQDAQSFSPDRATYWYAANGLSGRNETLCEQDWRAWNRKHSADVRKMIAAFAAAASERPVSVVVLWDSLEYVRTVCDAIDAAFGDAVEFVFGLDEESGLKPVVDTFGTSVRITLPEVCEGLRRTYGDLGKRVAGDQYWLPTFSRDQAPTPQPFSSAEFHWLEEDLTVLHLGVNGGAPASTPETGGFYRGQVISWRELDLHSDIDRDKTGDVLRQVQNDLRGRLITRINLCHWPGAGGTTIGRRVAWEVHREYPTFMLQSVRLGETIGRLQMTFDRTQQSLLVVVEESEVGLDSIDRLYSELRSRQIPCVLLIVQRKSSREPPTSDRTFFVDSVLSNEECARFSEVYSRESPARKASLEAVAANDRQFRNPFYYGLVAFGRDFLSIRQYVAARLSQASDLQKEVMTYLGLSHAYAQRPLSSQWFAGLVAAPRNKVVRLGSYLSDLLRDLVVEERDLWWRPVHALISQEIIKYILSGALDERLWKQNLSSWALKMIEMSQTDGQPSDETIGLLARLFVLRDNQEVLGKEFDARFSALIDDIPSKEGRLEVLTSLVQAYPLEPHFWGHLARYYSIAMNDFEKAIDSIDHALTLGGEDPTLHHMKGMCLGARAKAIADAVRRKGPERELDNPDEYRQSVEGANECFRKCRKSDSSNEYGYISNIQLLIEVVEFGFYLSGETYITDFLTKAKASWYREMLDTASGLLETAERLREGERAGRYLEECRNSLARLYGDHSRLIEGLGNLLNRRDVYRPPVRRQLARAYASRRSNQWGRLTGQEVERVLNLMEQNMLEEPADESNTRLWFQAAKYSKSVSVDKAIEKLSYWRANDPRSLDATYYLYILHVLKTLEGSVSSAQTAKDLARECAQKAFQNRNRTFSFEWLGTGAGLGRIVHYSRLDGRVSDDDVDLKVDGVALPAISGKISRIDGPQAGRIELASGLTAFFTPAKGRGPRGFHKDKDLNQPVACQLGFSYDGLRAWRVREI